MCECLGIYVFFLLCVCSLPAQLVVEAWLQRVEGVSRSGRVVGETVGLRSVAVQSGGRVTLEHRSNRDSAQSL